jgi:serine/threonine protein kinase/formylglycine-generating enzyme required for sulfatase activity
MDDPRHGSNSSDGPERRNDDPGNNRTPGDGSQSGDAQQPPQKKASPPGAPKGTPGAKDGQSPPAGQTPPKPPQPPRKPETPADSDKTVVTGGVDSTQLAQPTAGDTDGTQLVQPETTPKKQPPPAATPPAPPAPPAAAPPTPSPPAAAIANGAELDEFEHLKKALAGRYDVTKKLGAGGMASVYLAKEIALDRQVAIKLLPKSFMRDEQFIARFKREAQVAANLENPHIVRIYNISEEQDLCYFVMSLIPGGAITEQLEKQGTIPIDSIVQWGMDVCSALGYAHDHGVIHRDMKPDNIMLDKGNRAVVMDYGIARAAQGTGLTQTGAVIGTPKYMSPEQARGKELDSRSDIYSFGLVLYEMATGTLPFKAADAASLMYMHVHEAPEPPDVRNPDIPAWLRDIILTCIEKDPDDRFNHAKDLKAALAEHKAPDKTDKTRLHKRRAEKKKSPVGMIAAVAVVMIALAAGGWFWWQSQQQEPVVTQAPVSTRSGAEDSGAQPAQQEPAQSSVNQDDLTFQQAEMVGTRQAFQTYLDKYPEGTHLDEARDKIAAFAEQERIAGEQNEAAQQEVAAQRAADRRAEEERQNADRERLDNQAYENALVINTKESYATYLQSFTNGAHVDEARTKLQSLDAAAAEEERKRAEEQTLQDNQAFAVADGIANREAYTTYLISYPNGRNAPAARAAIQTIDDAAAFAGEIQTKLSAMSLTMATIPGGSFQMGSEDGDGDEKPVRTVTISGFTMATTEITQAQYRSVISDNPSYHKLDDNAPVERVTFAEAITFCNRLSERLELEACYSLSSGACDASKNGFRLPTEAEWEYACRSGSGSEYNTGDGESALTRAGWYQRNSGEQTHPVAQKTANQYGLYDMHGNVWEWTGDWYAENSYESAGSSDPTGVAAGEERTIRGGSWLDSPQDCRSAKRRDFEPDDSYSDVGFRIVRR